MGNSSHEDALPNVGKASVDLFYSGKTWIEGNATEQLIQVSNLPGVTRVCAFPDLHPGKYGPVGCAVLSNRLYPQLIGNDIGCGMSVFALDLQSRKFKLEKAISRLGVLEESFGDQAKDLLKQAGLDPECHRFSLGSIGGGNHFCEIQQVGAITSDSTETPDGITSQSLVLMVHSGSRSLGYEIFSRLQTEHFAGLVSDSNAANTYMDAHDLAVRWASLNRSVIAQKVANALRTEARLIVDNPHNLVERHGDCFLHRKGAAKADMPLVPLAGSRDAPSFLLRPGSKATDALNSLAHGSGRKYDRKSMQGRAGRNKSELAQLARNQQGGLVICEDRQLLVEEAPTAYKDPHQVLSDLEFFGLAEPVIKLQPLITYKRKMSRDREDRKEKQNRLRKRRLQR